MVATTKTDRVQWHIHTNYSKNTVKEVKSNALLKPISNASNYVAIAELTFT